MKDGEEQLINRLNEKQSERERVGRERKERKREGKEKEKEG